MIDLHVHSYFSDGTDTIDELLNIAKLKGISALALTDHDTTMGVSEITQKALQQNIQIIPGVEISSVSDERMIHILGYNIDIHNSQLQDFLGQISSYYKKCCIEQMTWLKNNGVIDYAPEKVLSYSSFKPAIFPSDIIKSMIADGLDYKLSDWPVFHKAKLRQYPNNFLDNFPFKPAEAVEIILQAGGVPVFAHPARLKNNDMTEMEKLIPYGLKGIEVYYPFHDDALVKKYEDFASAHDLIKTGGTDWHGELTDWKCEIGDFGIKSLRELNNISTNL